MKIQIRVLALLMFLILSMRMEAQNENKYLPSYAYDNAAAKEMQEEWWGYFDGDYDNISVIGLGASTTPPVEYSCAIRIEAGNPELLGKRIKALKYSFERLNYIKDVRVWMSKGLPAVPEEADICCVSVDNSTLKSFEKDNDLNVTQFPEPYQVRNEDIYIGYSFTVTSNEGDKCTYPIVVSYATTMDNAFLMNWGSGWVDNAGRNYGNLALMLLLDDGGEFTLGDVNYDMKINVVDVSYAIDYILNGKGNVFNTKGADIDGNGEINIVDVESIIDMILERNNLSSETYEDSGDYITAESSEGNVSLKLHSDNAFRGFQMDVVLPEGADITSLYTDASMASTHNLKYARVSDNRYRVIVSSANGGTIDTDDILFIGTASDDITIENIIFATSDLKVKRFADINGGGVTSIDSASCDEQKETIYDIYGTKVSPDRLKKGVYIVNGKKRIIK